MDNQRRVDVGISISQSGSPVDLAPDYKKVLDSRWRFMEVEYELDYPLRLPAISPSGSSFARIEVRVNILRHSLGFEPAIEVGASGGSNSNIGEYSLSYWADDEWVYALATYTNTEGAKAINTTIPIRVYNLPILQEYSAPSELVAGSSSEQGDVGVKVLDGSDRSVQVGQNYPVGFSVDTTKKILSVHRHGVKHINKMLTAQGAITNVNTTTDVLTYSPTEGYSSWIQTAGSPVFFIPRGGGALPAPLASGNQYFVIPNNSNSFKVATTKSNALAGTAVNITTAGTLPIDAFHDERVTDDLIYHDVGYPPTYLLARVDELPNGKMRVGPFTDISAVVYANNQTIRIQGVQAVVSGLFAYVILKDPAEIVG